MKTQILLGAMALLVTAQAAAPEAYRKLWRDPAINARIDRNIEQFRKGDVSLTVVDAAGQPLQLRGVNISGFEFWSIHGQDAATTLAELCLAPGGAA